MVDHKIIKICVDFVLLDPKEPFLKPLDESYNEGSIGKPEEMINPTCSNNKEAFSLGLQD
jgi:hypothetical protein